MRVSTFREHHTGNGGRSRRAYEMSTKRDDSRAEDKPVMDSLVDVNEIYDFYPRCTGVLQYSVVLQFIGELDHRSRNLRSRCGSRSSEIVILIFDKKERNSIPCCVLIKESDESTFLNSEHKKNLWLKWIILFIEKLMHFEKVIIPDPRYLAFCKVLV